MAGDANTPEIEIWKPVPSSGGDIEASSAGRVKLAPRFRNAGQGRVAAVPQRVTYGQNDRGYRVVRSANARKLYVHRLVCEAFHGSPPLGKPQVAHGDGNKANNRPENLRWVNDAENKEDALRLGERPIGERHGRAILDWPTIQSIRADYQNAGGKYGAQAELSRRHGISRSHVRDILTHRIWRMDHG